MKIKECIQTLQDIFNWKYLNGITAVYYRKKHKKREKDLSIMNNSKKEQDSPDIVFYTIFDMIILI